MSGKHYVSAMSQLPLPQLLPLSLFFLLRAIMQEAGEAASKKVRGSYSRLICLQCRARKIKCHLPDNVAASDHAQPADKACERCKQFGLDCVVSSSTLGRPALKRQRRDEDSTTQNESALNSIMLREARPPEADTADVEGFLLSRQLEGSSSTSGPDHPQTIMPSRQEIFESLTSPIHLLSLLLSRDKRFGKTSTTAPVHLSVLDFVSDRLAVLLDTQ